MDTTKKAPPPDLAGITNPTYSPEQGASAPPLSSTPPPAEMGKESEAGPYLKYDGQSVVHSESSPSAGKKSSSTGLEKGEATRSSGCTSSPCCRVAVLIFGGISFLVGVIMVAGAYGAMFDAILKTQMEVSPGSMAFDIWKNTPVPLSIGFYLYNLTNPEEFENGAMAELQEIGPYVYQEFHLKQNITFHPNSTVTFFQQRWWVWDQEASGNLSEDDPICILNTVPVSAAYTVRDYSLALTGLNTVLNLVGERLTMVQTAKDILFDGYEDPLLDVVQAIISGNDSAYPPGLADIILNTLPPGLLDYDRMGWFYNRNLSLTYDGMFNMFTGEDSLDKLGVMDWWDYSKVTDYFSPPCNSIRGSAGELWPPYQDDTNITFYSTDLCMSLTLQYKEDITDSFGMDGYRYWADERAFGAPIDVPENTCYWVYNETCPADSCPTETCPMAGLLDAQTCRMGSPAFISFPHFLHGSPCLLEAVKGVSPPEEEKHQMLIDMIPELGVPIGVKARMQINMAVQQYKGLFGVGQIDLLSKVNYVILPLLWFEVSASLTEDLASQLKPVLFLMRTPTITIIWCVMILAGAVLLVVGSKMKKQKSALIMKD